MRNRFSLICAAVVLFMAPVIFAQSFDPHDLSGIWSRNSQGYGGGGTCRGCGDRGFNNDVPPMTAWGQARFEANKPSYGRALGSPAAAQHPEEHIGRRRGVPPGQGLRRRDGGTAGHRGSASTRSSTSRLRSPPGRRGRHSGRVQWLPRRFPRR